MFLSIPPNQRHETFLKFQEIKRQITNQKYDKKLKNLSDFQKSASFLEPLIQANKENTELLEKSLHSKPKITNSQSQINRDPIYHIKNNIHHFGNDIIEFNSDHISINEAQFPNTPGLVNLITQKDPISFTDDDVKYYKKFLLDTKWIYNKNGNFKSISNKNNNAKKEIQKQLIAETRVTTGKGIIFLPSDKKSLYKRLNLCLGEFKAGNHSTHDEIVSILDILKEKKQISKKYYEKINDIMYKHVC